jgi:N-acetylglucosamine kinase-like BadF-type ATPase
MTNSTSTRSGISLNNMKLIADSGGTKTEWKLVANNGTQTTYITQGINAYFHTSDSIYDILKPELVDKGCEPPDEIFFYGAGCATADRQDMVQYALSRLFPNSHITVQHDLIGACRALCGDEAGLVCILGTGSNACLYDGAQIVSEERSLGYILGDEGSGAYLGKQIVTAYLQNRLAPAIAKDFANQFNITRSTLLERVYRGEYPNRYLAQFSRFFIDHLHDEDCYALVFESFADFIDRYVCTIPAHMQYKVHCSGSVGFYYKNVFERVLWAKRMEIGKVIHTPIEGLVEYHTGVES